MEKYLTLLILIITTNIYSQNVFQKELNGIWKIEKKINNGDTFINFSEYVKFINNEVHFFKIESGKEIEESVNKIAFITHPKIHIDKTNSQLIKLENGEVWELRFKVINNETRLIWEMKIDKNGGILVYTDDRGIIKNPEERKKALEGEIHTYYIKLK